jgi:predicted AAA+ superfamily ATPase
MARSEEITKQGSKNNDVLMVFGAKSVGESRVIMENIEERCCENRLVIDIDLKGIRFLPMIYLRCLLKNIKKINAKRILSRLPSMTRKNY